jgi:hypothetical protein
MVDLHERCPAAVAPFLTPLVTDLLDEGVFVETSDT